MKILSSFFIYFLKLFFFYPLLKSKMFFNIYLCEKWLKIGTMHVMKKAFFKNSMRTRSIEKKKNTIIMLVHEMLVTNFSSILFRTKNCISNLFCIWIKPPWLFFNHNDIYRYILCKWYFLLFFIINTTIYK